MPLSKKERMDLLVNQIELPQEIIENYFIDSEIEKLELFKEDRLWVFHLNIKKILPLNVYQTLLSHLQTSFKEIANVNIKLVCEDSTCLDELIIEHWLGFTRSMNDLSPAYIDLLHTQKPRIEDNKVIVTARNGAEAAALIKRIEAPFKEHFNTLGLSNLVLEVIVSTETSDIETFKKQTIEEDRQIAQKTSAEKEKRELTTKQNGTNKRLEIGYKIPEEPIFMEEIIEEENRITVQGYIFSVDVRVLRSKRSLLIIKATDYTDSLEIKMFSRNDEDAALFNNVKAGQWIKARGRIQTDSFSNELTMMANDIQEVSVARRKDTAIEGEKRIELHAHTTMSQLDAVVSPTRLIEQAADWGHEAIAITDHANVQAYPEAHRASKEHDIKVLYGLEANLVDDGVPIAYNVQDFSLKKGTYIVFDVETTGLSSVYDTIIELAGVRLVDGEIVDRFESFANPHRKLPQIIIDITGITDDQLVDAPEVDDVLKDFHEWAGDDCLVAHNATFDIGFLNQGYKKIDYPKVSNPVIDTLELARFLFPNLGNHRLNTLCKRLEVELTQHHRAIYDAEATAYLFWKLVALVEEEDLVNHKHLNAHVGTGDSYQHSRPSHCTILVQNQTGLKNLYKLVSYSHIKYFYREPRIPRSVLEKHREGLLIGSSCNQGEVFETVMQKSIDEAEEVAELYDYFEIQPPANYIGLLENSMIKNEAQLLEILKNIVELGNRLNKPVIGTGNVHYIDDHEKLYREVLIASQKGNPLNRQTLPDTPFRTTNEMLDSFSFLGKDKAKEIVVENSHKINDMIEEISPLQEDLYTPSIDGSDEEVRELTYKTAKNMYGENLPDIITERLEKELKSIIGHGFAVIYLISHKLVKQSLDDGYLVGSRGSVGSSLVATMTEITEVNPLPAHYICHSCHYNQFFTDGSYASGFDLPDKKCPNCDKELSKEGQDIPFETFLGFKGDKVPDIDLNFSGEYQSRAHDYTKELFGEDYVYRAGTIGTIAERTAYGYVKGYASDKSLHMKGAEIDRLVQGCTGVKRSTGQHPGGIIVVPTDKDIYDFTPIQYPANDQKSEWMTTHFDFHSIEDNLLKLDILGHDDPTMLRMLQDLSGIDPTKLPLDDPDVMEIFSSTKSLGVTEKQIGCKTGTLGVPEFGTSFVRQMLEETKPSTFSELVVISGLSHGTDVWLGNAQELINAGTCDLTDVIGCRDDIMVYLMLQGLDASLAFKIMESVRKGRGLQDEWIEEMKSKGVQNWYIESCKKIKYMFPKAHAAAYVLMAVRIAYYKVHHPIYFYAAYFSIRASDFELDTMVKGPEALRNRINGIKSQGNDATPKEKNLLTVLEVSLEMNERGFNFEKVDIYKSSASEFLVTENTLLPPFDVVDGLGTNAAIKIVEAREDGEFLSKEDLRQRSSISKTVLDYLDNHGCLEGMQDENQLSLF
ncbi:MAG TPA: PolC-type DNA polymerase III [Pseudogracilibacillus sp.]|nr:PolC-type DNA polymerase III [Pseudogracilibacillus sp.]